MGVKSATVMAGGFKSSGGFKKTGKAGARELGAKRQATNVTGFPFPKTLARSASKTISGGGPLSGDRAYMARF